MPIKEAQKTGVREAFIDTNSKDGQRIQILTAASTFAGDSSLGLESIDMILKTMLSTCEVDAYRSFHVVQDVIDNDTSIF